MPFTAGVYAAPVSAGAFNTAVTGSPATPDAWNALLTDISTALSTAVLKDGTQTITANIPMSTFKFTGLGAGSAATDSVTFRQVQQTASAYAATVGGTANAITLTPSPAVVALVDGMQVRFNAAFSNTAAATVVVNGIGGALAITWPDQTVLIADDIKLNAQTVIEYSSVNLKWHLMSVTSPVTSNILSSAGDAFGFNGSDVVRIPNPTAGSVLMSTSATVPLFTKNMYATVAYSAINGLTYQNTAGDVTNDLDIAAGGCIDATNAYWITVAALTKQSDAVWAVGTNAGMLDTGAVGNSDYYLWAIARSDTGVTDYLCSLSSTAPTMPANYDFKRLIGWFKRTGGAIVLFKSYEMEGGGLYYLWSVPTLDVNLAATLTTSRRTDAVKVPLNIATTAILNVNMTDASTTFAAWVYCPDQADTAPGNMTTAPLSNYSISAGTEFAVSQLEVRTSATGTIAARATLATVDQYSVSTLGFKWSRR